LIFPPLQFPAKILSQAPPTKSREGEEGGGDRIPQPFPEDAGRESKEARGGQPNSYKYSWNFQ